MEKLCHKTVYTFLTNKSDKDLADHYKEQLNAYINAIEQITNEKAEDALIYHIKL